MSDRTAHSDQPGLVSRLRAALTEALSARDMIAAAALRSALAAIGNAEAVPQAAGRAPTTSPHFASAAVGLGAGEARRRALGFAEIEQLVRDEISARLAAADQYDVLSRGDRADRLRREAEVLSLLMAEPG